MVVVVVVAVVVVVVVIVVVRKTWCNLHLFSVISRSDHTHSAGTKSQHFVSSLPAGIVLM